MPTWTGVTGTAIAARTETAVLSGTATVEAESDVYVSGTATVDRTSLVAWAAQARMTATRVFLGEDAEDLIRITGDVSVSLDEASLLAVASFVVVDPRCAFAHPETIAQGGVPVTIKVRIATPDATADTTVFRGLTEAAPSVGTHVPKATIQCAGEGAEWYGEKGCLLVPAFSGQSRLAILKAFAESVGISPDRIRGGEAWGTPRLKVDLSGISPAEMARRSALIEDHYLRLNGPDLEIIPARNVVGPDAQPIFHFHPGNFFSCSENPPNRPVSRIVLSSVGIPEEVLTGGSEETTASIAIDISPTGARTETIQTTTTVNGLVIRERIAVWRDYQIPGVTPSASAWRLFRLTESEATFGTVTVDGRTLRTSRIEQDRTTTREWYSPPCRSSSGSVWSDGTRHLDSSASWQVVDDRITTYSYDSDTCVLANKTINVGQWYSPLASTGHTYDDGAVRADTAYQWIAPDDTQPWERTTEVSAEESGANLKAVTVESRVYGYQIPPGSTEDPPVEEWRQRSGRDDRWSTVPGSGLVMHAWTIYNEDGSSRSKSEPASSGLPLLVRAELDVPHYRTRPIVLDAAASVSTVLSEPRTEPVWGAETHEHLKNAALQTLRTEHADRFTIRHPALPLLRKYDVITVTDPTWKLVERKGYVGSIALALNVSSTGKLTQYTVVVFPPDAYNPGVPVVEVS